MECISEIAGLLARLPEWPALIPPAALLLSQIVLAVLRRRRAYLWVCALCLAAETALTYHLCGLAATALLALFALLLYPAFFVPRREKREEREAELVRQLKEPDPARKYPPKVCCFEEPRGETAEERGMKLSHVIALLERLKKEKLTPADRLEVEMLSRSVAGAGSRPLTDGQIGDLNDELSAALKLMAKYS